MPKPERRKRLRPTTRDKIKRLELIAADIQRNENEHTGLIKRRDKMIKRLAKDGISERAIAEAAKVSPPRVNQIKGAK